MAAWNETRNNIRYKIHDVDHSPPHCHVVFRGRRLKVCLETLEVLRPTGTPLPPAARQYLEENQQAMLQAWQLVMDPDAL